VDERRRRGAPREIAERNRREKSPREIAEMSQWMSAADAARDLGDDRV